MAESSLVITSGLKSPEKSNEYLDKLFKASLKLTGLKVVWPVSAIKLSTKAELNLSCGIFDNFQQH